MNDSIQVFEWRDGGLRPLRGAASWLEAQEGLPQGAYTTLRTFGGRRVLCPEDHARRLGLSAGVPLAVGTLLAALGAALDRGGHPESRLRATWAPPRLFVAIERFVAPAPELYRDGARCVGVALHRERPVAKDTRFIARAGAAYRELPPGIHEGLLLGPDSAILEGLSSNFFAVVDATLRTAGADVLPGITRSLVLEALAGLLRVDESPVRLADLPRLREAFLTSASRGVLPVVEIDATRVGDGRPGPLTREIARRYDALVEARAVAV